MVEGFWILKIETPQYTSGGVVFFVNGKVFGGDNGFTWVGTYTGDDRLMKGRVHVHNFDPGVSTCVGDSRRLRHALLREQWKATQSREPPCLRINRSKVFQFG